MAKTEAEIREEIRKEEEAKRAEADRKREEAESKRTMMETIGGFFSGGIGSILGLLLLCLVAYTIGQTKWGQELIETGISYLPEDWQVKAHGLLDMIGINTDMGPSLLAMADKDMPGLRKMLAKREIPEDVVTVITKDKDTFAAFLKTVQEANKDEEGKPGKVNPTTMTNDKTLFALMTKQPVLVQLLAEAALKPGAGNSSTGKAITNSLRSIVSDERLDILLTGEHRANILALIKRVAQASGTPITDAQLTTVLQVGLDATGKATPNFRTFLSEALSRDDKGELQVKAALKNFAAKEPTLKALLIDAALAAPAPAPGQPAPAPGQPAPAAETGTLAEIKAVPQNLKALQGLRTALGNDKFAEMAELLDGNNPLATMKFALENRAAFEAFLKAAEVSKLPDKVKLPLLELSAIPAKAEKPILAILNKNINPHSIKAIFQEPNANTAKLNTRHLVTQLLDGGNRDIIAAAGADNVAELIKAYAPQAPASLNGTNLTAMLKAAAAIGENPKMADAAVRRDTVLVTSALADMLINDNPAALQKLKPEELASFFNDPANSAALKQLLIDTKGLPEKQAAMTQALLAHYDTISRVASDKEKGAKFVLDLFDAASKKNDADACKNPNELSLKNRALINIAGTDLSWTGTQDNIIGKNAEEIKHLLVDLQVADCPPPPSTPNGRLGAVQARHNH